MSVDEKFAVLQDALRELGSVLVAYSGGTDSAFLAWAAHVALGSGMQAVIADSASLPRAELAQALEFTARRGIPTQVLQTEELADPRYVRNDRNRCFHCKDELFTRMEKYRAEAGFAHIAFGMNADDAAPEEAAVRPGQRAAEAHYVVAPLLVAGLRKAEVRFLARRAGLEIADKPASACLSSRIEYGREVTAEALRQVEQGEEVLHSLGFRQVRVRHHGNLARVEIAREDLTRALSMEIFEAISAGLKAVGFTFVTLDLEGYRTGSMNAALTQISVPARGRL